MIGMGDIARAMMNNKKQYVEHNLVQGNPFAPYLEGRALTAPEVFFRSMRETTSPHPNTLYMRETTSPQSTTLYMRETTNPPRVVSYNPYETMILDMLNVQSCRTDQTTEYGRTQTSKKDDITSENTRVALKRKINQSNKGTKKRKVNVPTDEMNDKKSCPINSKSLPVANNACQNFHIEEKTIDSPRVITIVTTKVEFEKIVRSQINSSTQLSSKNDNVNSELQLRTYDNKTPSTLEKYSGHILKNETMFEQPTIFNIMHRIMRANLLILLRIWIAKVKMKELQPQ